MFNWVKIKGIQYLYSLIFVFIFLPQVGLASEIQIPHEAAKESLHQAQKIRQKYPSTEHYLVLLGTSNTLISSYLRLLAKPSEPKSYIKDFPIVSLADYLDDSNIQVREAIFKAMLPPPEEVHGKTIVFNRVLYEGLTMSFFYRPLFDYLEKKNYKVNIVFNYITNNNQVVIKYNLRRSTQEAQKLSLIYDVEINPILVSHFLDTRGWTDDNLFFNYSRLTPLFAGQIGAGERFKFNPKSSTLDKALSLYLPLGTPDKSSKESTEHETISPQAGKCLRALGNS